jgi:hypothetical protein
MLKLIKPGESIRLERTLIYGDPKTGKTRLATSLTPRFGEALYIAADPGAEGMSSILPAYVGRIQCLKPIGGDTAKSNPHVDAFEIATRNWQKDFPEVKTLIWDTMTATALDILQYVATSGQFSQTAHVGLGIPGSPEHQKLPMQGDYMATHNIISRLVDFLFKQPLHLIVICHAGYDEPKDGGALEGGPATAGKATIRSFPGKFDSVLHVVRKGSTPVPSVGGVGVGTSNVSVFTERHGVWSAGIRSGHTSNPMPRVDLQPDPINFWELHDSHFVPKEVTS